MSHWGLPLSGVTEGQLSSTLWQPRLTCHLPSRSRSPQSPPPADPCALYGPHTLCYRGLGYRPERCLLSWEHCEVGQVKGSSCSLWFRVPSGAGTLLCSASSKSPEPHTTMSTSQYSSEEREVSRGKGFCQDHMAPKHQSLHWNSALPDPQAEQFAGQRG